MKMPFGKYKGYKLVDLPASYIVWLSENVELREPLRTGIQAILPEARETQERIEQDKCSCRELYVDYADCDDYFDDWQSVIQ